MWYLKVNWESVSARNILTCPSLVLSHSYLRGKGDAPLFLFHPKNVALTATYGAETVLL